MYDELEILPRESQLFLQRTIFMHNLHYKKLPHALRSYCQLVDHAHSTRYRTELNYYVPPIATVRGQKSIKYSGPKAWRDVPKKLKDIAFRKPFSKKMKQHILSALQETNKTLPKSTFNSSDILISNHDTNLDDLQSIFDCSDENITFNGFELSGLDTIFNDSANDSYEFLGFDPVQTLESIFENSEDDTDFLGF